MCVFFSCRRLHTRCALVTGVQTCALPIYAGQNPNADLRTPLSLEEYERSPFLIAPLRKYDLAYLFDGGAAFVVAGLPWARDHTPSPVPKIGRASCRERVCQYV